MALVQPHMSQDIRLQPLTEDQFAVFADLLRYRDWRPDSPVAKDVDEDLAKSMKVMMDNPQSGCAIFLVLAGEEPIGAISIMPVFHMQCRQLSYWLHPDWHGQGIMTEAIRQFCASCFEQTKVVRLQAQVLKDNPASARVLEKNGFMREAVLPLSDVKDGKPVSAELYGKIKG